MTSRYLRLIFEISLRLSVEPSTISTEDKSSRPLVRPIARLGMYNATAHYVGQFIQVVPIMSTPLAVVHFPVVLIVILRAFLKVVSLSSLLDSRLKGSS